MPERARIEGPTRLVGPRAASPRGLITAARPGHPYARIVYGGALDAAATLTRASVETYLDANGVLQSAANNAAAFAGGARLQVYEGRTNLCVNGSAPWFGSTGWAAGFIVSSTEVTAPDGGACGKMTMAASAETAYQNIACLASTAYTWSFWVRLGTLAAAGYKFALYDNTALGFVANDIVPSVAPTTSGWTRITYSFTTPSGCTSIRPYLYRNSVGQNGTAYVWGAQLEAGHVATPYMPTLGAGVTATRAADAITVPVAGLFPGGEGTILFKGMVPALPPAAAVSAFLAQVDDGTANNRVAFRIVNGTTGIDCFGASGGSLTSFAAAAGSVAAGTLLRAGMTFKGGRIATSLNGGAVAAVASGGPSGGSLTTMRIGQSNDLNRPWNGEIETFLTLPFAAHDDDLPGLVLAA